ncbi:MAG: hypothetical protein K9W43_13455 [Candidatus Thorarchaeota archaeon]|nr:hypothetical protein [Candidatus Thorarchaeota archaeon]
MQKNIDRHEKDIIRDAEYLILLILGKAKGKISHLHLQKIFFFLWKFHPKISEFVTFEAHLKGPYSFDLEEIVKNPTYLTDIWIYLPPKNRSEAERAKGGYIELTNKGMEKYKILLHKMMESAKENDDAFAILGAIDLMVPLYTNLEWDELLFLLYTDETNKVYSEKSELSKSILKRAEKIVDRLIEKKIIPAEKKTALLRRANQRE